MLENSSNKLMATATAIVVAGAIYGTVHAAYPDLNTTMTQRVQKVLGNDTENKSIALTVNLPEEIDVEGTFYAHTIHSADGQSDRVVQNPTFEPNTFDEPASHINSIRYIRPERIFNYSSTVDDWEKNVADYYVDFGGEKPEFTKSPFLAKTSDGKDITKNIRFKSVKLTQLSTVDDHVYNDNIANIVFNKEYTDYGQLLDSLSQYNNDHSNDAEAYADKVRDGKHYAYIKQSKMVVTYTVSDDSGKNTQTVSSNLIINSVGSYWIM